MNKWTLLSVSAIVIAVTTTVQAHPTQIAFLNHVIAVVDSETVSAVEQSSFLPGFIDYEKKTVTANGGVNWTGRYLRGKSTYIELFGSGDVEGLKPGNVALAFGSDRVGDIHRMARHLRRDGVSFSQDMRRRNFDGKEVDWFYSLGLDVESADVSFWVMEYVAGYLDHPAAKKEAAEGPWDLVTRERYNSDAYRGKLVQDITYVAFYVSKQTIQEAMPLFLAAGYGVREADGSTHLLGRDAEIVLFHAEEGKYGLAQLGFVLNRSLAEQYVERIGNSVLNVGPDNKATWTFTVPEPSSETTGD
ncbi:DUF5829 family protein [Microbulbifer pacificus]|uniref:DUF5829 family protein n=1 Tax=Microbulbifer pacificus TaxID=407164 RepID=A0AAU0MXZ9_9GAMM|nr:DUF5829 family protein [Microbulbifer pacificus]WOX05555.1 DUF5829 family protein [Microbulbifer pacificus]